MIAKFDTGHVLRGAAFVTVPLALYVPRGLVPLIILAAFGVLVAGDGGWRLFNVSRAVRPVAVCLMGVVLWGGISSFWSVNPAASLVLSLRLFGLFVAGLVLVNAARNLHATWRARAVRALLVGILIGLVILLSELLTDGAIARLLRPFPPGKPIPEPFFTRTASVLALVAWPAALGLVRIGRRAAAAGLLVAVFGLLTHLGSLASTLAYACGLVVFILGWTARRHTGLALAAVVAIGIAFAPLLPPWLPTVETAKKVEQRMQRMPPQLRGSLARRLEIWRFVAASIGERPLLGWGLDSSRDKKPGPFMHPHNAALQWWLELGAVGATLAAILVVWLIFAASRVNAGGGTSRVEAAACLAQITTGLGIAFASYGIWQSLWLSTLWLSAVFTVLIVCVDRREHPTDAGHGYCPSLKKPHRDRQ